jgi:hypothetical protein
MSLPTARAPLSTRAGRHRQCMMTCQCVMTWALERDATRGTRLPPPALRVAISPGGGGDENMNNVCSKCHYTNTSLPRNREHTLPSTTCVPALFTSSITQCTGARRSSRHLPHNAAAIPPSRHPPTPSAVPPLGPLQVSHGHRKRNGSRTRRDGRLLHAVVQRARGAVLAAGSVRTGTRPRSEHDLHSG